MGQAKRRGTFEQRLAQAMARPGRNMTVEEVRAVQHEQEIPPTTPPWGRARSPARLRLRSAVGLSLLAAAIMSEAELE
jgi:hypothetical protein